MYLIQSNCMSQGFFCSGSADGYTTDDIKLQWANQKDPVKKYKDITMSQFTLMKILHGNYTRPTNHGKTTLYTYMPGHQY